MTDNIMKKRTRANINYQITSSQKENKSYSSSLYNNKNTTQSTSNQPNSRHYSDTTKVNSECVEKAGDEAIRQLESTYETIYNLSKLRQEAKQSSWRISSVAKELKELIKVMSTHHS